MGAPSILLVDRDLRSVPDDLSELTLVVDFSRNLRRELLPIGDINLEVSKWVNDFISGPIPIWKVWDIKDAFY